MLLIMWSESSATKVAMIHTRRWAIVDRVIIGLGLSLTLCQLIRAERLPIKSYAAADGLSNNTVNRIVRDSRGFLWFCTQEGLSRFDGYAFTNYGTNDGLPHPAVNDFLETSAGDYWVATGGGLVRFNPTGARESRVVYANESSAARSQMFAVVVPSDEDRRARFAALLREGRDGTIWCGTSKGLYRLDASGARLTLEPVDIGIPSEYPEQRFITGLVEDRHGSLWIATPSGLYRRWVDGSTARYTESDCLPTNSLQDLLIDHEEQLWVGTRTAGFFRLTTDGSHAPPAVAFILTPRDFFQSEWVNQLFETSDHKLWAAGARGLLEFIPGGDAQGRRYRIYTMKNGLSDYALTALGEDMAGNLWLGSETGAGVMKMARNGFLTYDEQDGILTARAIFQDRAGGVCFRGYVLGDKRASIFEDGKVDLLRSDEATYLGRLGRFDGERFTWFMPDVLREKSFGWVSEGVTLQARHSGEWWVTMGDGLYRFPATDNLMQLKRARPLAVYGKETVLGARQVFRIFEDSQERIWVSTVNSSGNGLALWERETQALRDLTNAVNLPSSKDDLARSFGEDHAGNVWVAFSTGLARYRDGAFTFFTTQDGLPPGAIMNIYADRSGRLWLATLRSGLVRVDDPPAQHPAFLAYTTAQGLSSNSPEVITEDLSGDIYIGTGRGLDRLNPTTGRILHYTTADGLVHGSFHSAFCDREGVLWFGTAKGLSRFVPASDEPAAPPSVLISSISISGSQQRLSALGERDIRLPDLTDRQNQVQIDFLGLSFAPGEVLRYQYKLEGSHEDWSQLIDQRSVNFASLGPGRYRFLVRAVNSDGLLSEAPASFSFTILPPIWQRWWFIGVVAAVVGLFAYALYRYRVARLIELERVRTRIAADLHDDVGSSLSQISVLSEVLRKQLGSQEARISKNISLINRVSQEALDSMSDIVWAINPQQDHLSDLVRRMRRAASEMLPARNIQFTFNAPTPGPDLKLGADMRRQVFLMFKEAINNIVRHSECTQAEIEFKVDGQWLALVIADNGKGFDPGRVSEGNGIVSLRRRARSLGGETMVSSREGQGTTITVRISHTRHLRSGSGNGKQSGNGEGPRQ